MIEVLEVLGAILIIAGIALIYIPAGAIAAGILCIAASFALSGALVDKHETRK